MVNTNTLVFVHDHKFIVCEDGIYSPGGLSDEVLTRYTDIFDSVIIIARVIYKKKSNKNYSKITNNRITIIDGNSISKKKFKEYIKNSQGLIIRLPSVFGLIAGVYALASKKKYLVELVGNPWDAYWYHSYKGKLFAGTITILTKLIVYHSKYVIYVTKHYLQRSYSTKGKKIDISNVFIEPCSGKIIQNRQNKIKNDKIKDKVIIGTIGSIDMKYKGQQNVIRAIKKLKIKGYNNIEYHLVGGGEGKKLKSLIEKEELCDSIKLLGTLPHTEVYTWLDSLDIYIQPSLTEGLPRSLVEAMSRGCPCIASSAGGNPELIDQHFIFKKKSVDQIMELIIKMLDKNNLMKQSIINVEKSKQYEKRRLDDKRQKFIYEYLCN